MQHTPWFANFEQPAAVNTAAPQHDSTAPKYTEEPATPAPGTGAPDATANSVQQNLDTLARRYAEAAAKPDADARVREMAGRLADISVVAPETLPDAPTPGHLGRDGYEFLTKLKELRGQNYVLVHAPSA